MAQATGTMSSTSRQGTGSSQILSFTITFSTNPPEPLTLECDEDYFKDAKDAGGKNVTATYDPAVTPKVCSGLRVNY